MFFFLSKFVPSMTFNMYWLHHSINLLKIVPFLGGWLSDRLLGDPEGWPHPIVWFGKAISAGEKELNKGSERVLKGGILAVVLILGNVNSNTNHFDTSGVFISMLFRTTDFFALVTSF